MPRYLWQIINHTIVSVIHYVDGISESKTPYDVWEGGSYEEGSDQSLDGFDWRFHHSIVSRVVSSCGLNRHLEDIDDGVHEFS